MIIILIPLILLSSAFFANADEFHPPSQVTDSVFMIRNDNYCATAFYWKGHGLLTNAHVSEGLCNKGSCKDIKVYHSNEPGVRPKEVFSVDFTVMNEIPSLDMALLKFPADFRYYFSGIEESKILPVTGEKVYTVSYPGCSEYFVDTGTVRNVNSLTVESNLLGTNGSSGSPLLNTSNQFVGIFSKMDRDGAIDLMKGLFNFQFKAHLKVPIKAVTTSTALSILLSGPDESLLNESKLLNESTLDIERDEHSTILRPFLPIFSATLFKKFYARAAKISTCKELKALILKGVLLDKPSELDFDTKKECSETYFETIRMFVRTFEISLGFDPESEKLEKDLLEKVRHANLYRPSSSKELEIESAKEKGKRLNFLEISIFLIGTFLAAIAMCGFLFGLALLKAKGSKTRKVLFTITAAISPLLFAYFILKIIG